MNEVHRCGAAKYRRPDGFNSKIRKHKLVQRAQKWVGEGIYLDCCVLKWLYNIAYTHGPYKELEGPATGRSRLTFFLA